MEKKGDSKKYMVSFRRGLRAHRRIEKMGFSYLEDGSTPLFDTRQMVGLGGSTVQRSDESPTTVMRQEGMSPSGLV